MRRHRTTTMLLAAAWLLAACVDSGGATAALPPASPPPSTRVATTTPASTAPPASSTTTTAAATTTVVPRLQLSTDGPWRRVDSAPGITTPGLFYELMPKLWAYLPLEMDLEHGIAWTLHNPDDIPVIEGYLRARLTYYQAVTQNPVDLETPDWYRHFVDPAAVYFGFLADHRSRGEMVDMDLGVVTRPEVIGDERTDRTAMIFDCVSDGGVFLRPDGTLAEGSKRGFGRQGLAFRMVRDAAGWKVLEVGSEPTAC